jgi:uncharacterized membrane protein YukC
MSDDTDELIREMSEKIKSLEEKENNRVSTPWGVYDKKTFNIFFWFGMGLFVVIAIAIAMLVMSDDPFLFLPDSDSP